MIIRLFNGLGRILPAINAITDLGSNLQMGGRFSNFTLVPNMLTEISKSAIGAISLMKLLGILVPLAKAMSGADTELNRT